MKRDNKCNSPSPDQENIVVLSTTVKELQDSNVKLATSFKEKTKKYQQYTKTK